MMVAITGVSGSGKSTLVHDVIYHRWRAHATERTLAAPRRFCGQTCEGDAIC